MAQSSQSQETRLTLERERSPVTWTSVPPGTKRPKSEARSRVTRLGSWVEACQRLGAAVWKPVTLPELQSQIELALTERRPDNASEVDAKIRRLQVRAAAIIEARTEAGLAVVREKAAAARAHALELLKRPK